MAVNIVLPEQKEAPFRFTDKALKQIYTYQKLLQIESPAVLRLGIRKKGANVEHLLGFDQRQVSDYLYRFEGLEVVVNRSEVAYLKDVEIDYKETPNQKGFLFRAQKERSEKQTVRPQA
jgi:Fe-S cluster assembly iron-binding protein IscA